MDRQHQSRNARGDPVVRYISDFSLTEVTSNPTIFERTIGYGSFDDAIARLARRGEPAEERFFALALEDLTTAANMLRSAFDATDGLDGWVTLDVSRLLTRGTAKAVYAAAELPKRLIGRISSSRFDPL